MPLKKHLTAIFNSLEIPSESIEFTVSLNNIEGIIHEFKNNLQPGDWLFLDGDLGAGKTTFVKKLVQSYRRAGEAAARAFVPEQRRAHPPGR